MKNINLSFTRRQLLEKSSLGLGWLAFTDLQASTSLKPHFKPKAKSVILVYLSGGLSQVDSFDPKPMLDKLDGKPMPVPVKATMFNNNGNIFKSPWEFKKYGQSGIEVSELFPCIAAQVDKLCLIRSMVSKASEHAQGNFHFHSGFSFQGYPSAGAWMSYGLGSENSSLPSYVVLRSGDAVDPIGGAAIYNSGFLPAQHQASFIKVDNNPVLPDLISSDDPKLQLRKLKNQKILDPFFVENVKHHHDVEASVLNYETAFAMQASIPEVCDLSREPESIKRLYGMDSQHQARANFAKQCITARRMVERGVRFIELSCLPINKNKGQAINPWDQHSNLKNHHADMAYQVDQPVAALLADLESCGLLDETIVVFSGEFGRTPFAQGSDGRDHNPYGFTLWVAGGGFKPGFIHGATDDLGYHAVHEPTSIYDLWATVQNQLGINHENLTYLFGGRNFRLSDVEGKVVKKIINI